MMKKIAILGSTGSIGTQTLDIVRAQGDLQVTAMAAGHNRNLFEQQIREFMPKNAALWEEKDALDLKTRVADLGVKVSYTCFSTSRFGVEEKFYLKERKILTKDAKSAIMHS